MRALASILFIVFSILPLAAYAQVDTTAKQAIIVDYDTGTVLYEKNADEKMPTSSMSKTMTVYLVFEALKNGKLKMDDMLPVSEYAWKSTVKAGVSRMFIHVGDNVKVEDLIRGVIIQSGNDASIVLAEGLGGTEAGFADMMNRKAQEFGMTNSHFTDSSGMPDPNHYSTARDLATLGIRLIRDFPEYYPIYSEKEFTYNNIKQGNRNPLLYRNIGGDGIKTGHTEDAGYGLMGSGTRNGRRVVLVLNGMKSMQERADESAKLLDWGLRGFENVTMFKAGDTVDQAPVVMGEQEQVPLVVDKAVMATVALSMRNDLEAEVAYKAPLMAPVKKGDRVGTLTLSIPRAEPQEYPLLAGADVNRLGFFAAAVEKLKLRFQ